MKGTVLYGPGDVRYVERDEPKILEPTDAIIRISATCVCGSDLWPYRGIDAPGQPTPMGHEYCGVIEEVGRAVKSVKKGQFVVGSFFASDNSCAICEAGYQSRCVHAEYVGAGGAQAPLLRVPLADGTLQDYSRHPMSSAPAGSPRTPPRSRLERQSRSSATALSVSVQSSRPSTWAPSASS
jgi:threonine dehydrogenase-like Zn-dependent dehydrogenase